jgi:hypothetical protein
VMPNRKNQTHASFFFMTSLTNRRAEAAPKCRRAA